MQRRLANALTAVVHFLSGYVTDWRDIRNRAIATAWQAAIPVLVTYQFSGGLKMWQAVAITAGSAVLAYLKNVAVQKVRAGRDARSATALH